jgi:hypothetical protein
MALNAAQRQAVAALKQSAADRGATPTQAQYARDAAAIEGAPTVRQLSNLWPGGWREALRVAGLHRQAYDDRQMLDLLAGAAKAAGRMPTARQINADSNLPSASLYLQRFGSLDNAREKAGIAAPSASAHSANSTEQMIEDGLTLAQALGRLPGWRDWADARTAQLSLASEWQVYRRFGGGEGAWRLFQYYLLEAAADRGLTIG